MESIIIENKNDNENGIKVEVFDENENYKLYHYSNCYNDSSNDIKNNRGIIMKNDTNKMYVKTFSFTPEYYFKQSDIKNIIQNYIDKKYTFFPSYEGSLLRLWYDNINNKWILSTHKKLNAFESRWGSKMTFGDIFLNILFNNETTESTITRKQEMLEEYSNQNLNKNHIYTFLITTSMMNRIVCRNKQNDLYYLGYFDRENDFKYMISSENNNINLEYRTESVTFDLNINLVKQINLESYEQLEQYIQNNYLDISDYNKTQGIVCFNEQGDNVKIINDNYARYSLIRGNEPNLLLRYIELMKNNDSETIKELKELYQESRDFEYYDKTIYHIKRNLLSNYIKRYIQKSLSIVPPEQNRILVDIYNLYISDPSNNRISLEYINDYLNNLSTPLLYNLYKQYQKRRSVYGNGNYVDEDTKKKVLNSYYKEQ